MYWKQWKKQREDKLKKLKERAKGFADLKPRHIRRATQIYKDEFYASLDKPAGLNVMFDVEYGEGLHNLKDWESPLLKLIKKNNDFTGKTLCIPINLSTEKIP
jgi:hypothetical protein